MMQPTALPLPPFFFSSLFPSSFICPGCAKRLLSESLRARGARLGKERSYTELVRGNPPSPRRLRHRNRRPSLFLPMIRHPHSTLNWLLASLAAGRCALSMPAKVSSPQPARLHHFLPSFTRSTKGVRFSFLAAGCLVPHHFILAPASTHRRRHSRNRNGRSGG